MPVVWRAAVHADLPRILELWDEQDARFAETGVPVDRPELFYPDGDTDHYCYPYHAPLVRVRVAERDGEIVGWKYQEAVLETCVITGDKEVMDSLGNELTEDAQWAKSKGFRSGWGLVHTKFVNAMARALRKFPHIRPWRNLTPVGINFNELGD